MSLLPRRLPRVLSERYLFQKKSIYREVRYFRREKLLAARFRQTPWSINSPSTTPKKAILCLQFARVRGRCGGGQTVAET